MEQELELELGQELEPELEQAEAPLEVASGGHTDAYPISQWYSLAWSSAWVFWSTSHPLD